MQLDSQPPKVKVKKLPHSLGYPLLISVFLSLLMFLISLVYLPTAQPELPLFYTLDETTGPLVKKWYILIIPSIALLTSLINIFIVTKLNQKFSDLMVKLYTMASLMIVIILTLALIRIIYVTR